MNNFKKNTKRKVVYIGSQSAEMIDMIKNNEIPSNSLYCLDKIREMPDFDLEIRKIDNKASRSFYKKFLFFLKLFYRCDVFFTAQFLDILLFKKFFLFSKCKWVIFNLNLTDVLRQNNFFLKKKLLIKAINNSDGVICLSLGQKKELVSRGVLEKKLFFVKFGVDENFYYPKNSNSDFVLSVGRDAGRDYATLIKAAEKIDKEIVIISSKKNVEKIKKIPKNVKLIFNIDYERLREYYQAARIVVVPSKEESSLGALSTGMSDCSGQTVVLEAMACGKPVIASSMSWMNDYRLDDCIIKFQAENHEDLAEKINFLFNNNDLANNLARKARDIIIKDLNSANMAKQLASIFKNI